MFKVSLWHVETVIIPYMLSQSGVLFIIIVAGDPKLRGPVKISQIERLDIQYMSIGNSDIMERYT